MSFKENFNRICAERGTSASAVCIQLGLSTSKVSAWNNGALPKESIMLALAKKLECSVMDFFTDDTDLDNPINDDERDMLRIFRALPRRKRHEFMSRVYEFDKEGMSELYEGDENP